MKKIVLILLFACVLNAQDISNLQGLIELNSNEKRIDHALSKQGNGQMKNFGSTNDSFTLKGSNNSSYTLNSKDNVSSFNTGSIDTNTNLFFNGFHTLVNEKNMLIRANANFSFISSGVTISAAGSEYGGNPKTRFSANSNLSLEQNAKATFSNADFFIHYGQIVLKEGSILKIDASQAIRIQNKLTSHNANINLTGDLYNVADENLNTSSIQIHQGTFTLNGNFYNGGETRVDRTGFGIGLNIFDPIQNAAGELIIKNALVQVDGKFVSVGGKNLETSRVQIYGGTLSLTQGFENKTNSELIFGISDKVMGKLQGDLKNDGGRVLVDTRNAILDTNYQIITGTISNDLKVEFLNNANFEFLEAKYQDGSVMLTQKKSDKDPSGNTTVFQEYKSSLNSRKQSLLDILENKFQGTPNLLTSDIHITQALNTIDSNLQHKLITQPQALLSSFKTQTLTMPIFQDFIFENIALNDSFYLGNIMQKNTNNFYLNSFDGALLNQDLKAYLAGFNTGYSLLDENYITQFQFSYAKGLSYQKEITQNFENKADFLQLGFISRNAYTPLEADVSFNILAGFFSLKNENLSSSILSSRYDFNNFEGDFGLNLGYRLGDVFSFKPFLGFKHYFVYQSSLQEKGGLGLQSKPYTSYIFSGTAGFESSLELHNKGYAFMQVLYEHKFYTQAQDFIFTANNQELKYKNTSYKDLIQANLGFKFALNENTNYNLQFSYKYYNTMFHYLGANLMLEYLF